MKSVKIYYLILFFILLINPFVKAQRIQSLELNKGLSVKQYDVVFEGYYGFPYLLGILYKNEILDSYSASVEDIKNQQHFGGRMEYMIQNNIGIGLEYTQAALTFKYKGIGGKYYLAGVFKRRFLAKVSVHFGTTDKADPYVTFGGGYTISLFQSEEPDFEEEKVNLVPVATRLGMGIRYFINDFIGFNIETGIGGPIIQAGLTVKL